MPDRFAWLVYIGHPAVGWALLFGRLLCGAVEFWVLGQYLSGVLHDDYVEYESRITKSQE